MGAMTRTLDTRLLRTFVAVVDKASMTAAANALHLTQGAVSQQVRRLEDALGCTLFERDRRGLRLTPHGERLFGQARKLLALHDEMWAEMTTVVVEGQVRLGVPPDLVGSHLTPVLRAYAGAFPRVEVSLVCAPSRSWCRRWRWDGLTSPWSRNRPGRPRASASAWSGSSGWEPRPGPRT